MATIEIETLGLVKPDLAKEVAGLAAQARAIRIVNEESLNAADELLGVAKGLIAQIKELFGPHKKKAHEAHRALCDDEAKHLRDPMAAEVAIKQAMAAYQIEARRKHEAAERERRARAEAEARQRQREEQDRLRMIERARQEEERLAEAAKVEVENGSEAALAFVAAPLPEPEIEDVPLGTAIVVPLPAPELPRGVTLKRLFEPVVRDIQALSLMVGTDEKWVPAVEPNMPWLRRQTTALAQAITPGLDGRRWLCPGVEIVEVTDERAVSKRG